MRVRRATEFDELLLYQQRWDELAGDCAFRTWTWLNTWWKHYGLDTNRNHHTPNSWQLYVLLVFDDTLDRGTCSENTTSCSSSSTVQHRNPQTLVGILPCYLDFWPSRGKLLRLLGDGEVCSEHLDLLCHKDSSDVVATAVADYLVAHASDWDVLVASTMDSTGSNFESLTTLLGKQHAWVRQSTGLTTWSIRLPDSWEAYLAMQSKSHRKQLRQLTSRVLETDRTVWKVVQTLSEFDTAWEYFIDLHQRRRESLGEPGCFASPQWANFHRDVAKQLLESGKLRLSTLSLDGRVIAAEYHFVGQDAVYVYQGGLDPERADDEPGRLSMIRCIQQAIAEGRKEFDLLRGDEPYKPHWRAEPRTTMNVEIVSPRALARWRSYSWNGLRWAGRFVQKCASLLS